MDTLVSMQGMWNPITEGYWSTFIYECCLYIETNDCILKQLIKAMSEHIWPDCLNKASQEEIYLSSDLHKCKCAQTLSSSQTIWACMHHAHSSKTVVLAGSSRGICTSCVCCQRPLDLEQSMKWITARYLEGLIHFSHAEKNVKARFEPRTNDCRLRLAELSHWQCCAGPTGAVFCVLQ